MSADWSPLYLALIHLLSTVISGTLLYKCLVLLAANLLAVSNYLFLDRIADERGWPALMTLILLASPISPLMERFANLPSSIAAYFGLAFFLLGLRFLLNKPPVTHVGFAMFPTVLASLFRPEYFVAVIWVFLYGAYSCWRYGARRRFDGGRGVTVASASVLASAGLYLHYGLPIASYGRGLFAFGQHYSVRFCDTYPAVCGASNGWADWEKWFALSFGPGNVSLSHMLAANPNAFLSHVSLNFLQLVATVLSMGFAVPVYMARTVAFKAVFACISAVAVGFVLLRVRRAVPTLRRLDPYFLLCAGFSLLPFCASCILAYPRIHYAVPLVDAVILLTVRVGGTGGETQPEWDALWGLVRRLWGRLFNPRTDCQSVQPGASPAVRTRSGNRLNDAQKRTNRPLRSAQGHP
jgi:hypothetical protein